MKAYTTRLEKEDRSLDKGGISIDESQTWNKGVLRAKVLTFAVKLTNREQSRQSLPG